MLDPSTLADSAGEARTLLALEGYLCHVLERTTEYPINRIEDLLSWSVALPPVVAQRQGAE